MPEKLESDDIRFLLKVIVESKNIHGLDLERAIFTLNKLQNMLKELNNV